MENLGESRGRTRWLISAEPWSKHSRSTIEAGEALANFGGGDERTWLILTEYYVLGCADAVVVNLLYFANMIHSQHLCLWRLTSLPLELP